MFTGRYEGIPGEDRNITPSTWRSMGDSFKAAYQAPFQLLPETVPGDRSQLQQGIAALEDASSSGDQGLVQKSANWVAGLAGSILNPLSLVGGEVGGAVASKLLPAGAGLLGRYLPVPAALVTTAVKQKTLGSVIGESAPKFVGEKTVGDIAQGAVSGFGTFTGFSLPQEVANTYNAKDDSFNWWGGIKASSVDGGVGLGLMAVPYLGGALWGKIFKGSIEGVDHAAMPQPKEAAVPEPKPGQPPVEPTHPAFAQIDKAEEQGKLSAGEAKWFRNYLTGDVTNEALTQHAVQLLIKDGHPVDAATKKVLLNIFKPEEVDQLQTSLADKLANTVPENMKSVLSDFMINSKVDDLRKNTKMLDGIQGVVEFIKARLARNPEETINLQRILQKLLPEDERAGNPFSQAKVYHAIKSGEKFSGSIPKQVEKRMLQREKIKTVKQRLASYRRALEKTGKEIYARKVEKSEALLNDLHEKLQPLLTHKEEMAHLRSSLIHEGQVKENFKAMPEYERLLDLTRVKNDARKLMHEIHVKHEYAQHEHYANFLDTLTTVMRSSVSELANKDNVINYLKERMIREHPDLAKVEKIDTKETVKAERQKERFAGEEGEAVKTNKTYKDDVLESFDREMHDAPEEVRQEYDMTKNQFKEFNESQGVFKNLIKCIEGSLNV